MTCLPQVSYLSGIYKSHGIRKGHLCKHEAWTRFHVLLMGGKHLLCLLFAGGDHCAHQLARYGARGLSTLHTVSHLSHINHVIILIW